MDKKIILKHKQREVITSILNFIITTKTDFDSLMCYTQAILHEITCDGYMYLDDIPKSLDIYLEEFKIEGSATYITNHVQISTCTQYFCEY